MTCPSRNDRDLEAWVRGSDENLLPRYVPDGGVVVVVKLRVPQLLLLVMTNGVVGNDPLVALGCGRAVFWPFQSARGRAVRAQVLRSMVYKRCRG